VLRLLYNKQCDHLFLFGTTFRPSPLTPPSSRLPLLDLRLALRPPHQTGSVDPRHHYIVIVFVLVSSRLTPRVHAMFAAFKAITTVECLIPALLTAIGRTEWIILVTLLLWRTSVLEKNSLSRIIHTHFISSLPGCAESAWLQLGISDATVCAAAPNTTPFVDFLAICQIAKVSTTRNNAISQTDQL
jgi:hypothetical protein